MQKEYKDYATNQDVGISNTYTQALHELLQLGFAEGKIGKTKCYKFDPHQIASIMHGRGMPIDLPKVCPPSKTADDLRSEHRNKKPRTILETQRTIMNAETSDMPQFQVEEEKEEKPSRKVTCTQYEMMCKVFDTTDVDIFLENILEEASHTRKGEFDMPDFSAEYVDELIENADTLGMPAIARNFEAAIDKNGIKSVRVLDLPSRPDFPERNSTTTNGRQIVGNDTKQYQIFLERQVETCGVPVCFFNVRDNNGDVTFIARDPSLMWDADAICHIQTACEQYREAFEDAKAKDADEGTDLNINGTELHPHSTHRLMQAIREFNSDTRRKFVRVWQERMGK